jgi:hypothetical protein
VGRHVPPPANLDADQGLKAKTKSASLG